MYAIFNKNGDLLDVTDFESQDEIDEYLQKNPEHIIRSDEDLLFLKNNSYFEDGDLFYDDDL
jgi:hypothetical protein